MGRRGDYQAVSELLYLIVGVLVLLLLIKMAYTIGTIWALPRTKGALFVSTSHTKIKVILNEIPLSSEMKVADLGCGDGRFLRAIWRRYKIKGDGYEINPWAFLLAKIINFVTNTPAKIYRKDFLKVNLSSYNVVFCYLFPDILLEVAPKLKQELLPGSIVISCNFPLPGWLPERTLRVGDPIFIYRQKYQVKNFEYLTLVGSSNKIVR